MVSIGYAAMMEQFDPNDLLAYCVLAEDAGFRTVMVSDHFQPWTPRQGQSGFSWAFMAALGAKTSLRFGPGVVCPLFRYHPAIVAQAAATLEVLYPGRTWLGLGSGEALNEHVIGAYWPEAPTRVRMLFEALDVISALFSGKTVRHKGEFFTVETTRLYTLPDAPPPIYVATAGPVTAERTGRTCDGIITVGAPDERIHGLFERFARGAAARGKDPRRLRRIIRLHVSFADTHAQALEQALREWPVGAMRFSRADIRNPEDFDAMARLVRPEDFQNRVLISPDIDEHLDYLQRYIDMGFDEIYLHNVGRNQEAFIHAYGTRVLPRLKEAPTRAADA
ncbi:MAG: LLM class F420-dependent oxidoreductase [Chloroflexi bacterium]|nr:MAG: LLM class F420-dependent oxidoreductase [Chloroflexota bacterium]